MNWLMNLLVNGRKWVGWACLIVLFLAQWMPTVSVVGGQTPWALIISGWAVVILSGWVKVWMIRGKYNRAINVLALIAWFTWYVLFLKFNQVHGITGLITLTGLEDLVHHLYNIGWPVVDLVDIFCMGIVGWISRRRATRRTVAAVATRPPQVP